MAEINGKNKKIALLGFIVFAVLVVGIIIGGSALVKSGNLDADASTAVAALKAQLNAIYAPKTVTLDLKNAFAVETDTDISTKYADSDDIAAIAAADSNEDEDSKSEDVLEAHSLVYFEYCVDGEKENNRFLAYICDGDKIVVVNNTAEDGTAVTGDKSGIVSAVIEYGNTGLANITYINLTSDGKPLIDYPENTQGFKKCDAAALNRLVSLDN